MDTRRFLPHVPLIPNSEGGGYPAGALACALYLMPGIRGMGGGQLSMDRDTEIGEEILVKLDLVRPAMSRKLIYKAT